MINLILFGPPGSGKGTQAKKLEEKFDLFHISTGDLFRYEIGNKTELGKLAKSYIDKGELVPDSVTVGMLKNKIDANPNAAGFIFDGFPRTIPQAEALDQLLADKNTEIKLLILLTVADEEIVQRILMRAKTSGRTDDADETIIRNRIDVYNAETAPVYNFYDNHGKAIKVNGLGSIEEIFTRLSNLVEEQINV